MTALAPTSFPFGVQHIQHERFAKQHGYQLFSLSLASSGDIAASGYNYVTNRTFIDLYFGGNYDSKHKLVELRCSQEFSKHSDNYRVATFLDSQGSQILNCIGDKVEIYDTKNLSHSVRRCTVRCGARCLAFSNGKIFLGLYKSPKLLVFDKDLKETNTIDLKEVEDGDFPLDFQVIKETIFVCTGHGRALSIRCLDGSILTEYRDSTGKYKRAHSISVGERLGLVAVLWGMQRVILYFLSKNKPLLCFDVDFGVHRIIISDKDRMMITGNLSTGEIKMSNLEQVFSFEAMKKTLANTLLPHECEELRNYFGVSDEDMRKREEEVRDRSKKLNKKEETLQKAECLLTMVEENGYLDPCNVRNLMDAVSTTCDEMRCFTLQGPMEGYTLYGMSSQKLKYEAMLVEIMNKQKAWEGERCQLSSELRAANTQLKELENTTGSELSQFMEHEQSLKSQLGQAKQLLDLSRDESAKKIETLTRELKMSKDLIASNKTDSDELIKSLKEELDKTKKESFHTIKTLTEELSESVKQKETLTKQLDHTRQLLDLTKSETSKQIEELTLKLEQTLQKLNMQIKEKNATLGNLETTKQVSEKTAMNRRADDMTKSEKGTGEEEYLADSQAVRDDDFAGSLLEKDSIFLYKEQYIDENGGDINLPELNAQMSIPAGALSEGSILSLTMMTDKKDNVSSEGNTPRLTPIIKCGPEGLTLNKQITVRIPHCALETDGITSTDINFGFSNNEERIKWRKRKQNEPAPIFKEDHFEALVQTFCYLSMDVGVDFDKPLAKRLRVLPLMKRVINSSDDFVFTVWIYNDDETEHMHILHKEIDGEDKIQLHDFKRLTIKGLKDDREVHIKRANNNITPYSNVSMKKVLSSTMWGNARHSVEFNFQNNEGISDINFKIRVCKKQFLRSSDDLQFDIKVTLSELPKIHQNYTKGVFRKKDSFADETAFHDLVGKLSRQLSMDSCLKIARLFGLTPDTHAGMKESTEPGKVLLDELKNGHLLTPACVSTLDIALISYGDEKLAKLVKEYRKTNAANPTTMFRLL